MDMKVSDELLIVSSAFRYRETTLWLKQLIYLKDFNCRNIFCWRRKKLRPGQDSNMGYLNSGQMFLPLPLERRIV